MRIILKLIFPLLILSPSCAFSFNVDPYHLGMSNKNAAKFGLTNCKEVINTYIECDGTVKVFNKIDNNIKLKFLKSNKSLEEISYSVQSKNSPEQLTNLYSDLKMIPCQVESSDDGGVTCYKRPFSIRRVAAGISSGNTGFGGSRGYQSRYNVYARNGSSSAIIFFKKKYKSMETKKELNTFQAEK